MRAGLGLVLCTLIAPPALAEKADEVDSLNVVIQREGLGWRAGHTSLTDLPPAERALRHAGWQPPPVTYSLQSLQPAVNDLPCGPVPDSFPNSLDWRDHEGRNWTTPVRDQGACGACWTFATVGSIEGLISWRMSQPDSTMDLSEQQLLSCVSPGLMGCNGGMTWDVPVIGSPGTYLGSTGLTTESCYPYLAKDQSGGAICNDAALTASCKSQNVKATLVPLTATFPGGLSFWDPPDYAMPYAAVEQIKTCLMQRPVGVSMRVFDDFYNYHGGVYAPTATAGRGGLHAITAVGWGYDGDPNDISNLYWIVKNSWGTDWGESGYFKIRYNASSIGMFSFAYQYAEERSEPAFCDIPTSVTVDGSSTAPGVALHLANCGSGVLKWTAAAPSWLGVYSSTNAAVTSGAEVAAGTVYQLRSTRDLGDGASGDLVLTSGTSQVTVHVVATARPLLPDAGVPPSSHPAAGATDSGGCAVATRQGGFLAPLLFTLLGLVLVRRRRQ